MRKSLRVAVLCLLSVAGVYGQSNNPHNDKGVRNAEGIIRVKADYDRGIVKEFNQQTIDKYAPLFVLKTTPTTDMVATILRETARRDLDGSLARSNFSQVSKDVLRAASTGTPNYEALVDRMVRSSVAADEKEEILIYLSTGYNLQRRGFDDHMLIGGIGGIAGGLICGPPCAGVGFIVGFITSWATK